jgi:hypothetical protein
MPTLAEARARLRRGLEDTDPVAPLWTDVELNEWLAVAAREYGARFPREATVTIAAVGGQTEYPLPPDARRVLRVESPVGWPIPRRASRTGHESGAAQSWAHFGGAISLGYAPGAPLVVAYRGLYPFPASDSATFDLPDEGLDLAIAGATILALQRREIAAAKRRGGSSEVALALAAARRSYADALRCCRRVRAEVLG